MIAFFKKAHGDGEVGEMKAIAETLLHFKVHAGIFYIHSPAVVEDLEHALYIIPFLRLLTKLRKTDKNIYKI